MPKIIYEVRLNENGRPYIELPEDYEQDPEDRFFAIEVVRWMLQDLYSRRGAELDVNTLTALQEAEMLLGQLGDEIAEILYNNMKAMAEIDMMLDKLFHVNVKSIEERDALPDKNIFYNGKIFNRIEGLLVQINDSQINDDHYAFTQGDFTPITEIYELVDGISNEHWVKLSLDDIRKKLGR